MPSPRPKRQRSGAHTLWLAVAGTIVVSALGILNQIGWFHPAITGAGLAALLWAPGLQHTAFTSEPSMACTASRSGP